MNKVGQIEHATKNSIVQLFQQQLKFDYWGNRKNVKATATNNLHIKNPCPFVPTSMNKNGSGFFANRAAKPLLTSAAKLLMKLVHSLKKIPVAFLPLTSCPGNNL